MALASWNVTVFGAGLVPLETISVTQPGVGQAVFAGMERFENIVRLGVVQTAGSPFFTFLDDVRFEQVSVPEPTTLALLGLGVLAVVRKRRKKTAA